MLGMQAEFAFSHAVIDRTFHLVVRHPAAGDMKERLLGPLDTGMLAVRRIIDRLLVGLFYAEVNLIPYASIS